MYEKSKSCVIDKKAKSGYFSSESGVKQGEILSPLLFALYINDLENQLKLKGVDTLSGIKSTVDELKNLDDIEYLIDLLTLYYADDTIIFSDSALGLQFALDELHSYCITWKLVVNEGKTKIMCITRQRQTQEKFYYNDKELEVVKEFVYLGITFTQNGLTGASINARELKGEKAMFGTLTKCKQNNLPVDISLELFEKMVSPCMLYGSEIWGFNNCLVLEKVQLKYIKYSLNLKKNTKTAMVYGETGIFPVEYQINIRMISFWISLLTGKQEKISSILYKMCLSLHNKYLLEFKWLDKIKEILVQCGLPYVFEQQHMLEKKWLENTLLPKVKYHLKDLILQKWYNEVTLNSEKCFYYKNFEMDYQLKNYLTILPKSLWVPLIKFRTRNHKLPIEFNSWTKNFKPENERKCVICDLNDLGDEYHYVMICPVFREIREIYLKKYYRNRPSVFKFTTLMQSKNHKIMTNLAKFIREIMEIFQ